MSTDCTLGSRGMPNIKITTTILGMVSSVYVPQNGIHYKQYLVSIFLYRFQVLWKETVTMLELVSDSIWAWNTFDSFWQFSFCVANFNDISEK